MKYTSLLLTLLLATPVQAQEPVCVPREQALKALTEVHGETRQVVGLTVQGAVMEVFASTESGTWTLIATFPNQMTCEITSGGNFMITLDPQGDPA